MVVACGGPADTTTLALVAAAHQTGGNVICIVPNHQDLISSKNFLGIFANQVQFMVGKEGQEIIMVLNQADFVLIDCNFMNHEEIVKLVQIGGNMQKGIVVVGYNAFSCKGWSIWRSCGSKTKLLPIGEGLLVTRFRENWVSPKCGCGMNKSRGRWVVKVDKYTGEEHIYKIRVPRGKVI